MIKKDKTTTLINELEVLLIEFNDIIDAEQNGSISEEKLQIRASKLLIKVNNFNKKGK